MSKAATFNSPALKKKNFKKYSAQKQTHLD